MVEEICIERKSGRKGEDGYRIVSVRMREGLLSRLDDLSSNTNRSRNELINLLLSATLDIVKIED